MDNILINFESKTIGIDEAHDKLEELIEVNEELKTIMEELKKANDKNFQNKHSQSVEEYRKNVNDLNKDLKAVSGHIRQTEKSIATLYEALNNVEPMNKNRVAIKSLNSQISDARREMAQLSKEGKEGGKRWLELTEQIKVNQKALNSVNSHIKAMTGDVPKLSSRLKEARNEMQQLEQAGEKGSERWRELADEAARLATQISHTNQQIKAMSSDTQLLSALIGGGQGLTGAFNASQSAMALLGGESEELQQAFFRVQASLQVLNGVQMLWNATNRNSALAMSLSNAMSSLFTKNKAKEAAATTVGTAATVAQTAATSKATIATKIWNGVILANPIFWIVAAIMATVAAIAVLTKSMNTQKAKTEELKALEERRLEINKRMTENINRDSALKVAALNRELEILQSLGASEEELAAKRRQILQENLDAANKRTVANQEDIDNLEENMAKVAELENQFKKLNDAIENGDKRVEVEIDGEIVTKKVRNMFGKLKKGVVDGISENTQEAIDALEPKVELAISLTEGAKDELKELDKFINEEAKKARERDIRDAAIIAQIRLDAAKKGTAQELQLRINLIEKERQVALSAANLTAAEIWKINSDANRKIVEARQGYAKQQLIDEKTGIEARLALAKEGSMEEFDLRKQLLFQQYQIEIENVHLTNNEREKLYNEYVKNLRKVNDDFNKQASADALNTQIATINAQLAAVEKGTAAELELKRQLAEKQAAIERLNIETSIMNEELRAARLLEVDAKLKADLEQNQRDYEQRLRDIEQQRINNKLRVTHTEIEAERIKNEKILASTTDNFIKRNKARQNLRQLEIEAVEAEMNAIAEMRELDIINEEEYLMRKAELRNEYDALEIEALQEKQEAINAIRQASFELGVSLITDMMNAQKEALQQQLADMKEYYTTSEDEAKENTDKQLITKEELARRELEIKRKIAEAEKRDAIFRATVDGIAGVIKALGAAPPPFNIALAAITGAAVAAQLVKISSKELPKYAKGKKGKKLPGGELSWVGEQGPEIQWIPNSASIVPAHKSKNLTPDILREFNIKVPDIPAMPKIRELPDIDGFRGYKDRGSFSIDYDKLGKAVAENVKIPEVKQLNVELNENGYTKYLTSNSGKTKIFNTRYSFN